MSMAFTQPAKFPLPTPKRTALLVKTPERTLKGIAGELLVVREELCMLNMVKEVHEATLSAHLHDLRRCCWMHVLPQPLAFAGAFGARWQLYIPRPGAGVHVHDSWATPAIWSR